MQPRINQILTKLLDSLNERDREILKQRFVDGRTLEAMGKEFSLTRERVRQLLMKFSRRLRHPRTHLKKELNAFLNENQQFADFSKFLDKYGIIEQEKRLFLHNLFDYAFKEDFMFFNDYITNKEFENILAKAKETTDAQIQEIGLPFRKSKLFQVVRERSEEKDLPISSDLLEFSFSKINPIFDSTDPKLVVYISKLSFPDNLALILKNYKEPTHFADLARHITKMIRKEVTPHHLEARMRGDKRFILADAGKFILFRNYGAFLKAQTGMNGEEIKHLMVNIVKKSYGILKDGEDFTDTNFLLSRLKKEMDMPDVITPYALKDLLLRFPYFKGGRKFEIRLVKKGEGEKEAKGRRKYADLIWEVLYEANGPLHVEKIRNKLREKLREISLSGLNMILSNNRRFVRVDQSTYTIPENLNLTKNDLFFIKSRGYELIKLRKEPTSSIFLIQQLMQHSKKYDVLNCQAIYSILKKDSRFIDLAPSFFAIKENLPSQIKSLKDYVRQTLKQENMPLASNDLIKILNKKLGYFDKGNLNTVTSWDKSHIVKNYGFVYLKEWEIAKVLPEIFEKGEKRIRKEIEKFIENPGKKKISLDQLFIWLRFCMWSGDVEEAKNLVKIIDRFKPEEPEKEYLDKVKSKLDI